MASKLRSLFIHKVILPRERMLEEEKEKYGRGKPGDYQLAIRPVKETRWFLLIIFIIICHIFIFIEEYSFYETVLGSFRIQYILTQTFRFSGLPILKYSLELIHSTIIFFEHTLSACDNTTAINTQTPPILLFTFTSSLVPRRNKRKNTKSQVQSSLSMPNTMWSNKLDQEPMG